VNYLKLRFGCLSFEQSGVRVEVRGQCKVRGRPSGQLYVKVRVRVRVRVRFV
jgi:hypothetical protein